MSWTRASLLVSFAALLSCDALYPTGQNPNNCILNPGICDISLGQICNADTKQCEKPGQCAAIAQCSMASAVQCNAGACVPCTADTHCQVWSTQRSVSPALNICVKATGATGGTCGQCFTNSDCAADAAKAVCDPTTHLCRGCLLHSECDATAGDGSGICYRPNDVPTPSASMIGRCVASSSIAYLGNNPSGCETMSTNPSSPTKPYCNLNTAMMAGKQYIRVLPSPTPYPALTLPTGTVTLIGPGRDASPGAIFPSVAVTGAATLNLSDVTVSASAGASAVSCDGNGTLNLVASSVVTTTDGVAGVEGKNCTITIDRTRIQAKSASAIVMGKVGTTLYRIVNSAVLSSGLNVSGISAILLDSGASGTFNYNTVTRNQTSVFCSNTVELSNSLLLGNSGRKPSASCGTNTSVTDESVSLDMQGDPKLQVTSANRMLCVDQGTKPPGNEIATDFFGNPRPLGKGWDKGCHELE